MKIHVGVPWRPGCRARERNWEFVCRHLVACEFMPVTADSGHDRFNRAASRNQIVRDAETADADVVIFHDADMIAPPDAYPQMAALAFETGRMVIGFTVYRALHAWSTEKVLAGLKDPWTVPVAGTTNWSVGGIFALTPQAWRRCGGMDERFRGWGCEDFALYHEAEHHLGPTRRLPNDAVHLWHPHAAGTGDDKHNGAILAEHLPRR
jgi:predicted glycosyltransferase involved in capsule biosynthesis